MRFGSGLLRSCGYQVVLASLGKLVMEINLLRRSVPAGQTYQAITPYTTNNRPTPMRFGSGLVRSGGYQVVLASLGKLVMEINLLRRSVPAGQTYGTDLQYGEYFAAGSDGDVRFGRDDDPRR